MLCSITIYLLTIWADQGLAYTIDDCPSHLERDFSLTVFGNTCYYFETEFQKNYKSAHQDCFNQGGSLVTVKTKELNDFLVEEMKPRYPVLNKNVWLGLKYDRFIEKFYWVDGIPLQSTYSNFKSSDHGHQCVAFSNGQWVDDNCGQQNFYICQFPVASSNKHTPPSTSAPNHGTISLDDCPSSIDRDAHLKVFEDKCYAFHIKRPLTFHDAVKACSSSGGRLVMIKTSQIDKFIVQTLMKESRLFTWMGLRYLPLTSTFKWIDGDVVTYSNIRTKVFDTKADCVSLHPNDGVWEIRSCLKHYGYVCEYDGVSNKKTRNTTVADSKTTAAPEQVSTPRKLTQEDCPVKTDSPTTLQVLGDKCYFFSLVRRMSFNDAEEFCESYSGTLAMPTSKTINGFLHYHIVYTHGLVRHTGSLWIGLYYNKKDNSYVWINGNRLGSYRNFKSDVDRGCYAISPKDGKWQYKNCLHSRFNEQLPFICEFNTTTDYYTKSHISSPSIEASLKSTTPTIASKAVGNAGQPSSKTCSTIEDCALDCSISGYFFNTSTSCFECKCDK